MDTKVRRVEELPMVAFAERLPVRDEMNIAFLDAIGKLAAIHAEIHPLSLPASVGGRL